MFDTLKKKITGLQTLSIKSDSGLRVNATCLAVTELIFIAKGLSSNMLLTGESDLVRSLLNSNGSNRKMALIRQTSCILQHPPRTQVNRRIEKLSPKIDFNPCQAAPVPTSIIWMPNKSYSSYLTRMRLRVRTLRCINNRPSITVTYDGLPDTVVKKLLSNRHVVRFHSPRA